jgi:hypothetical protein
MSDLSSSELEGRRLYIEHLAERLQAMEAGRHPMNAVVYRLFARRILGAIAGYPERRLQRQLGRTHDAVRHAIEQRLFEQHGALQGEGAARAARLAALWLDEIALRR